MLAALGMRDILQYRRQFYEKFYDLRVLVPPNETADQVGQRILDAYNDYAEAMRLSDQGGSYVSTRGVSTEKKRFGEVVLQGLASGANYTHKSNIRYYDSILMHVLMLSDGGLFVPTRVPRFDLGELSRLAALVKDDQDVKAYAQLALRVLEKWIPELHPQLIRSSFFEFSTFRFLIFQSDEPGCFIGQIWLRRHMLSPQTGLELIMLHSWSHYKKINKSWSSSTALQAHSRTLLCSYSRSSLITLRELKHRSPLTQR
jgi:hypothetical protein